MNAISFTLRRILYPASALFTVIWMLVCVIIDLISDTVNNNLSSALMCFVIALALAGCNLVLQNKNIPFVGRYFLHMVLSIFSVSITVAIFSATFDDIYAVNSRSFYLVLLLVVCYLVIATPILLLYHRFYLSKKEKQA